MNYYDPGLEGDSSMYYEVEMVQHLRTAIRMLHSLPLVCDEFEKAHDLIQEAIKGIAKGLDEFTFPTKPVEP